MSLRLAYWGAVALTLAIYATMLIWTLPGISGDAAGLVPFDLRPTGYSATEAQAFLAALGEDGRALYQGPQRFLDLVYPVGLAITLGGGLSALIADPKLRAGLLFFVICGMCADYGENYLVAQMLAYSGPVPKTLVDQASLATIVKSAATGLAMVALIGAVLLVGLRKWRAG